MKRRVISKLVVGTSICCIAASACGQCREYPQTADFPPWWRSNVTTVEVAQRGCKLYVLLQALPGDLNIPRSNAVVNDATEHQWIIDQFLAGPGESRRVLWLAPERYNSGSDFQYMDGGQLLPLSFTAWATGQPDNQPGCMPSSGCFGPDLNECRLAMNWDFAKDVEGATLGTWNDLPFLGRTAPGSTVCDETDGDRYLSLIESEIPYLSLALPVTLRGVEAIELLQGTDFTLGGNIATAQPVVASWERDGQPIADGLLPGGTLVEGANTGALTLRNMQSADMGIYTLVLNGACGTIRQELRVYINPTLCRTIDVNYNGVFPEDADLDAFWCWVAQGPGEDFNNDGVFPDDLDIIAFISVLAGGPCLRN